MKNIQVTEYCRHFMKMQVKAGDICIDATVGNGHDTKCLAELVGEEGKVIGFDIQQAALDSAQLRLGNLTERTELHLESHENMKCYAQEGTVSLIVFNFGYLPGGDHKLATRKETSIPAIRSGLKLLEKGGVMILCIYSGGDSGFEEHDGILKFVSELNPHEYLVMKTDYYNRKNNPPVPVIIIKL